MTNSINIKLPEHRLDGVFSFKKYKASTGDLVESIDGVGNLILNSGLEKIKTTWLGNIYIGTGSTPPVITDVSLQNGVAVTSRVQAAWNSRSQFSADWVEGTGTWRFNPGEAVGNFTEVGLGTGILSNQNLFSRALIVDSSGNPISLTVLADEYLDVTYTLRLYVSQATVASTVNISGANYTFTTGMYNNAALRVNPFYATRLYDSPSAFTNYSGNSIAFNGDASSTSPFINFTSRTNDDRTFTVTYPSGQYSCVTSIRIGLNGGSTPITGIAYIISAAPADNLGLMASYWRALISPAIPKTGSNILTLNITWSWARYTP